METSFKLEGCDEFIKKLDRLQIEMPDETAKALKDVGRDFAKDVQKNAKGKINNPMKVFKLGNFKRKVYLNKGLNQALVVTQKSKLFHLLEYGHDVYYYGHKTGSKATAFEIAKATRDDWEKNGKIVSSMNKALDNSIRKAGLR